MKMRKWKRYWILMVIAAAVISCGSGHSESTRTSSPKYVSVSEARKLVQAWLDRQVARHMGSTRQASLPMEEVTSPEIRDRLHAQVFRLPGCEATDAYLIKDRKVYPMGWGFGGWGLLGMCVADVDGNGKDDLVYTYSWGSGLHRTVAEAYMFGGQAPTKITARFAVMNADAVPVKRAGNRIYLCKITVGSEDLEQLKVDNAEVIALLWKNVRSKSPGTDFGELMIRKPNMAKVIDIKLDSKLPEKLRKDIWPPDPDR